MKSFTLLICFVLIGIPMGHLIKDPMKYDIENCLINPNSYTKFLNHLIKTDRSGKVGWDEKEKELARINEEIMKLKSEQRHELFEMTRKYILDNFPQKGINKYYILSKFFDNPSGEVYLRSHPIPVNCIPELDIINY